MWCWRANRSESPYTIPAWDVVQLFEGVFETNFHRPKPKRRKKERKEPQEPTRHSSRLAGAEAEGTASELALFVINDECPRCGKVR